MIVFRKWVLRNEQGEGGGDGGGFDMNTAVLEIGEGLGFKSESDDGLGNGETVNEEVKEPGQTQTPASTPAPSPAPAPAPTPAPAPGTPAPPAPTPAPAPAAGTPPARFTAEAPPTTWSKAAAEGWSTIPAHVREEIAKRENDMFRGLEQYREGARFAGDVQKALSPVADALRQHNIPPQAFVQNMVNTHLTLADVNTPVEKRAELAMQLLKSYGIDIAPRATGDDGTPAYVDPEVKALREELAAVKSKINGAETQAAARERSERAAAITAFAEDPAHPYFDDVADDIALLIRGSGGTMSLQDAYERAVRANPVTFAKETARLQAEAVEKAQKEAAERVEAARKASGARVKTDGHQGSGTAASGSMESTMEETLAAIRSRERK